MAKRATKKTVKKVTRRKMVKVAMIGAGGRAAAVHYPSLRDMKDVKIVGVSELNEARLQTVGEQFGIKGLYTNYVEMIEKEKPDVVYVIMPPHHMYDVCATVIQMGCHLMIEKPPFVTSEQTRQMAILARDNKVLTGVTFQRRFAPVIRTGKEICEKKGPVHSAVSTFYKCAVGGAPYYRGAIDILACDAIHAVDTLRYLCGGEVESVASDVRRLDAEHVNVHQALIKFSSGATGVLLTNWMTGRRLFTVEIHSPGISVFGDPEEGGKVYADGKVDAVQELDPFAMTKSDAEHVAYGAYATNRHLIDCVKQGKQPETNFFDALKSMELVDAIYQSQI
ncbi:MAG: Gfo/Idh/MocA family oxidoreductase [Candidatus Latescibacteria bacterium]|jgi:virulence factor|nr:Gfo/Idh/MocA family oxidoreductase [Candidatus Latescibacterota bacterium]MBT4137113.1 Gfo/Idh/MocA family oxidoreductase [Candidatus Latescibacterota bacterium]MBT5829497.1 Gfo/Idh/MocA family oxidoreductase [Candidatus Latescibacterota bacterium]